MVFPPQKLHPVWCSLPRRILIIGVRTFINPGWHEEIRLQCTNCSAASQVQLRKNPKTHGFFQQASFCWSSDWRERCGSKVAMVFGALISSTQLLVTHYSRYSYYMLLLCTYIIYIAYIDIYVYHQNFGINTIFC